MYKNFINPWKWQDALGFSQGIEVGNVSSTLFCAGQAAMSEDGQPIEGNMQEQIRISCENLLKVITTAGYDPANIIRLNIYTTSVADFFAAYGELMKWTAEWQCIPASTLIEVQALAFPQLQVELEATVSR